MGKIKETSPVKLIIGAISGETALFDSVEKILREKFGPVDLRTLLEKRSLL